MSAVMRRIRSSLAARMAAMLLAAEATGESMRLSALPHKYIRFTFVGSLMSMPPSGRSSIRVMISTPKSGTMAASTAAVAKRL